MAMRIRPVEPTQSPLASDVSQANAITASNDDMADPDNEAHDSEDDSAGEVFWDVSPATYRLVWLTLLLLYLGVTLYLLGITGEYLVLMYVPAFSYYAATFHLIPADDLPLVTVLYGSVVIGYALHIVQFFYYSLRYRRLVFPTSVCSIGKAKQPPSPIPASDLKPANRRLTLKRMATRTSSLVLEPVQRNMLSTSGFCSVRGVFFEPVVMLREVVEIAIQTSQAYMCSRQTTKLWVNTAFAILIVVNCYSSPLLHRFSKPSNEGMTRVAVLTVDLALDIVWFAMIPSLVWLPYLYALMHTELVMYGDTYIIEGIMELPVFFVTSYVDLLLKLWPPVSIYFTMRKIELLTRRRSVDNVKKSAIVPSTSLDLGLGSSTTSTPRWGGVTCDRVEKWLRLLLLCWGHAIAMVYVYANFIYSPSCSPGCQLVLRPWFQSSATCQCAALELNCLELGIEGSATEIHEALSTTHAQGLLSLMITHCPALSIPPTIRNLHDLYGLVLLNCTLETWDDTEAAITSAFFPQLSYVILVHTPVSEVPRALLHEDLPPTLFEIDIIGSNLTKLPDNVDELWRHVTALLLEDNSLSEFLKAISNMPALEMLSLYDNQISSIPDDAFL